MSSVLRYEDYTVVWIAILPIEAEVALKILDKQHDGLFESAPGDDYLYIGGELNGHNVAVATLPAGQNYGVGSAAALAKEIKIRFPNIWFALLVGVAAGLPNLSVDELDSYRDIRLGDVLVSESNKFGTGIVHYDLGRNTENGFHTIGRLAETPAILRSAFSRMKLLYERPFRKGSELATCLQSLQEADGDRRFARPESTTDRLFGTSVDDGEDQEIYREPRKDDEQTLIWYGNLGSGNSLMRNARQRDNLRDRYDLIGLEMEAAGVMNILPTGVIRGVSDYGDKHKTKRWQPYAAAVAAVFAREVLNFIRPRELRDYQDDPYYSHKPKLSKEDNDILASLAFARMQDRRLNIHKPHEGTCHWILSLQEYREWDCQPQGLLWIKGKPGAGKSTVMSFLYSVIGEKVVTEATICLEFFFSARGETLQHTCLGMLRSLMNQLYQQDSKARSSLRDLYREKQKAFGSRTSRAWEWQEGELMLLLQQAILESASRQPMSIFIDALDEAGETSALVIAEYFHAINVQLASRAGSAKIYISCRHYPIASGIYGTEICVEEHNQSDIQAYIKGHIHRALARGSHSSDQPQWNELANDVVQQAKGVFQWVSLLLPIIARSIRNGLTPLQTRRRLVKVPVELSSTYEYIIRHVIDHDSVQQSFLLFQWVCFAERPLRLEELRYALATYYASSPSGGTPGVKSSDTDDFIASDQIMKIRLRALSGGLLETTDDSIQVVHQTVKEFLIKTGLALLESMTLEMDVSDVSGAESNWISRSPDQVGLVHRCHARLYWSCLNYMVTEQVENVVAWETDSHDMKSYFQKIPSDQLTKLLVRLPFIAYATQFVFSHARKAEHCHRIGLADQSILVERILCAWEILNRSILDSASSDAKNDYEKIMRMVESSRFVEPLHVAAAFGLYDFVQYLLGTAIDLEEKEVGEGCTALHLAARYGRRSVVLELLAAGSKIDAVCTHGYTALIHAAVHCHDQVALALLKCGCNVNAQDSNGDAALLAASRGPRMETVQVLLEHGANPNIQDKYGTTALMEASVRCYMPTIQLLLKHGADVNIRRRNGETALMEASVRGSMEAVQLLLNHGADVNAQGDYHNTALMSATQSRHTETVQLLLEHGADANAQSKHRDTALTIASWKGDMDIVRLLLEHKADVNAQAEDGDTPLMGASRINHTQMVQLLLDHGADLNTQDRDGDTALMQATWRRNVGTMRLLLARGADVNVRNTANETALMRATDPRNAFGMPASIIQLLREYKAE